MIFETLEFLRLHLNEYIRNQPNGDANEEYAQLFNVSTLESVGSSNGGSGNGNASSSEFLSIGLVNLQEEFTLKNQAAVRHHTPRPSYQNPPVLLNLYMLVCACHSNYNTALKMMSLAVTFFQSKNSFTYAEAPTAASNLLGDSELAAEAQRKLNIKLDLYSLTFEQLNHLWGTLGGKQYPFALYKIRIIEIDADHKVRGGGYIQEIDLVNT